MLKFRVSLDSQRDWAWSAGRWRSGTQWIQPFLNPALECGFVQNDNSVFVTVRERLPNRDRQLTKRDLHPRPDLDCAAVAAETRDWPLDFIVLEISPGRVTVRSGIWGTAPIYLVANGDEIRGSWDFSDLCRHIQKSSLDDREIARFLTRRHRYTRRTISSQISRLTAGTTVDFSADQGLSWLHPEPSAQFRPRQLRPGAQVVRAYESLLSRAVGQWSASGSQTVVELSGGMDSATVAWALAKNHTDRIASYGLLVGGEAGSQQVRRRNALAAKFGTDDVTVDAQKWLPFDPRGQRMAGSIASPWDEPYSEALEAALSATDQPVVFTGIGGDELFARRGSERTATMDRGSHLPSFLGPRVRDHLGMVNDDLPPATVIPETALTAMVSRSPVFLRAGRWPVSPLCSPALVRFGEWLPLSWRDNKQLARELLANAGLSAEVVQPRLRENFSPVMQAGLRQHGLPLLERFLRDSVVVDLGYVDGSALRRAYDAAVSAETIDTALYEVIALELGLRSLV